MAAIYTYSTDPNVNTTVGGIFIGEFCPAANLNDGERALMADLKVTFDGIATLSDWLAGTAINRVVMASTIRAVQTPTVLTDGATLTVDLSTGAKFTLTKSVSGSIAFTNAQIGEYKFYITQDATGSRSMTITPPGGVTIKYRGAYPGLSIGAGLTDIILIEVVTSTLWYFSIARGFS